MSELAQMRYFRMGDNMTVSDGQMEDMLRQELIEQGKQMNDLRSEHQQQMSEQRDQLTNKYETDKTNSDLEHRQQLNKLKEQYALQVEKIKQLEKNEIAKQIDKAQVQSQAAQIQTL